MSGFEGLLTGHTLAGRYRIEEVIGRGGMAAVYRAEDEMLRRMVAVKVITVAAPDADARRRLRARFQREARAAARLQHPHVVTVFDFGNDERLGLDFLVMGLLHGEDLAAWMARRDAASPDEAVRILAEAAEGIGAGHRAGLIHRDVKPGNVFLEERDGREGFRVCVLDFGIAKILASEGDATSLTRGRTPLSPAYASPEQLLGHADLTPAADVYSLGVIGYELFTGERLFGRDDAERERGPVPPLRARAPHVPEAVAAVIDRAMAEDPADRFADGEALAAALRASTLSPASGASAASPATASVATPVQRAASAPSASYRARRRPRLPDHEPSSVPPATAGAGPRGPLVLVGLALAAVLAGWWLMRGDGDAGPGGAPSTLARRESAPVGGPAPAARPPVAESEEDAGGVVADPEPAATVREPGGGAAESEAASPVSPPAAASAGGGSGGSAADHNGAGMRHFDQREYSAAAGRFRRAVELAPQNAYYRNNLGWALFRAGEVGAAARELDETVRLDPARDIAYANIGEVRLAQGDTAGAIAAYERFLQLNSDPRRERIASAKLARIR